MTKKQNNSWAVQFNVKDNWQTERWFRLNSREAAEKYMADQERFFKGWAPHEWRIVPDYLEAFNEGGA